MKARINRSRSLLACIGNASRWRVVSALDEADRCVTELASRIGLSQSCTTRHLQVLVREGVARGTRRGKRVVFALVREDPMVRELLEWALSKPGSAGSSRSGRAASKERDENTPRVETATEAGPSRSGRPSGARETGSSGAIAPPEARVPGDEHPDGEESVEQRASRELPPMQNDIEDWLL